MRAYFPALNALGLIIAIFGLLMGVPLLVSLALNDGANSAYHQSLLLTVVLGGSLWLFTRGRRRDLQVRDGFFLVAATWVILPLFGALPLLHFLPELGFTDAYFEAASGLTATGATVLSGLDLLPTSINLWRTFMHWIGGMGVLVLVVAVLPLLGIGGRQLYKVEAPTPMKDASLTPRVTETAKGLWLSYFLLTAACAAALWGAGMPGWDAVIHSLSIAALGGFSSKDASLGYFDNPGIELVTILFALLAGLNFATHYLALMRRSFRPYRRDPELPFYFVVLLFSILMLTFYLLWWQPERSLLSALRSVAFHVVSISTSLGLVIEDYSVWPMFAQIWMLFLGSFVACSGSTGGGMKMMRAMILYKQVMREIVLSLHPHAVKPVRMGKQPVANTILHAVLGFSFMYMVSIVSLTLVLVASGLEIVTAFSAVIACLNNTGPGLEAVGPTSNYQALLPFHKWVLAFTMILGRLEIFTLLVVLTPAFWRR